MRILANEATNKFKIAEVEKEIQAEKLKNEASNKLKLRLNLKKGKGPEPGSAAGKTFERFSLLCCRCVSSQRSDARHWAMNNDKSTLIVP